MYCSHCMSRLPDDAQMCSSCNRYPIGQAAIHHLPVGTMLNGRYMIGDAIGEGGFGITYIGLDTNLDMKIAVKEFYPHGYANRNNTVSNEVSLLYSQESEYYNKAKNHFLNEAKSIAKFSNEDAIVDVRDYFTANNTAYIVMEYVEGVTLAQHLKRYGVFTANDILRKMAPLMVVLRRMHHASFIHRDISPDNIMMTDKGQLKLMDFGSARYFSGDERRTMSVVLKPGYAPFEQYSEEGDQGPWTDVYGLCATIYKCITGVTPPDAMARCQHDQLKPPSELGCQISRTQESAILKGMAIYPEDRLRDINALVSALAPPSARPVASAAVLSGSDETIILPSAQNVAQRRPPMAQNGQRRPPMAQNGMQQRPPMAQNGQRRPPMAQNGGRQAGYDDTFTRFNASPAPEPPEKKSFPIVPIVAAIIALLLVILIVVGVIIYFFVRGDSSQLPPTSPTARVKVVPTLAPTEEPTEEEEEPTDGRIYMPNVTGRKYTEAKAKLEGMGLTVEITREKSETVAKDYVIRQSVDEGLEMQRGDSVMLYVSDGQPPAPTNPPSPTSPPNNNNNTYDIEGEVSRIKSQIQATQADPGTEVKRNGVTYYVKNGKITMIVCPYDANGWSYAREYYFDDGELYFAYVKDSQNREHRLCFVDGVLIRYADPNDVKWNYGNINCPVENDVVNDAYDLENSY